MRLLTDSKAKPRAKGAQRSSARGLAASKAGKAARAPAQKGHIARIDGHRNGSALAMPAKIGKRLTGVSKTTVARSADKAKASSKATGKASANSAAVVRGKAKHPVAQAPGKPKAKVNGKPAVPAKSAAKSKKSDHRSARPVAAPVMRKANGTPHVVSVDVNGARKDIAEIAIANSEIIRPRPVRASLLAAASNAESKMDAKRSEIVLPPTYRPSDGEPFMNERQRVYFRNKLVNWKDDIVRQNMETLKGLHEDSPQQADPADRATAETDRALELRARDRQRKLMGKIDAALARLDEGSYGYCEETGEPISLKRLDARPIATLSLEAQERRERRERIFRED